MQFQARYYITPESWARAVDRYSFLWEIWRHMRYTGSIPLTAVWSGMEGDFFIGWIMQARW